MTDQSRPAPTKSAGPPDPPSDKQTSDQELRRVLGSSVAEGEVRLGRPTGQLVATGLTGGLHLGLGVIALLVIEDRTGSHLLAAFGFGIGFVIMALDQSELFTENFLVPVTGVAARRGRWTALLRLWAGLLVANLAVGWLMMGLVIAAHPQLGTTADELASPYLAWGIGWSGFAAGVLGGMTITALTWVDRSTSEPTAIVLASIGIGFVLVAPPLNHSIVGSFEMFAALHAGASFGYIDWLRTLGWAVFGNVIGGVGVTSAVRLLQIGATQLARQRDGAGAPAG